MDQYVELEPAIKKSRKRNEHSDKKMEEYTITNKKEPRSEEVE